MSELSSLEAKRANKLQKVLWHGASPHRWSLRGASIDSPHFLGGCYMTPSARLASMYCADWTARPDKRDFIQLAIREVFAFGDPEELLALGFIVEPMIQRIAAPTLPTRITFSATGPTSKSRTASSDRKSTPSILIRRGP